MAEIELEAMSWSQIYGMLLSLSDKIRHSGFDPDILVGVCRGGWIPACVLSDLLQKNKLASIRVEFYMEIAETRRRPVITQPVSSPVEEKKVLVVDDVVDTGESISMVKHHLEKANAEEVRIAVLYYKPWSKIIPDYYERETRKWVVFPWEVKETVISLIRKYLKSGRSVKEAKAKLIKAGIEPEYVEKFARESGVKID